MTTIKDNFKDTIPAKGYFKVETFDKTGKLVDKFEQHNIVVNAARVHFMNLISGQYSSAKKINRLFLGTEGIQNNDDSLPKDEKTGVDASLTDLFCGASADLAAGATNHKIKYDYVEFTPTIITLTGSTGNANATGVKDNTNNASTVNLAIDNSTTSPQVTYTFNIDAGAFNGPGYIKYNEAGLFADDTLIAMRTFKSKSKDDTTTMRITWTLVF